MKIKNIHKIVSRLSEKQLEELDKGAELYAQHASIQFKVEKMEDNSITIRTLQDKNFLDKYLDSKNLIERTRTLFVRFFPSYTIHVHPVPYNHPDVNIVTAEWVQEKMKSGKIKLKEITQVSGLDYTQLSSVVNGKRPLSQLMKAYIFYFFSYTKAKNETDILTAEKDKLLQEVKTLEKDKKALVESGLQYLHKLQKMEKENIPRKQQLNVHKVKSRTSRRTKLA
jgi:hypothetical protein